MRAECSWPHFARPFAGEEGPANMSEGYAGNKSLETRNRTINLPNILQSRGQGPFQPQASTGSWPRSSRGPSASSRAAPAFSRMGPLMTAR